MPTTKDKEVIVILGASSVTRMMPLLLVQLHAAGIPTRIATLDPAKCNGTLGHRVSTQRKLVDEFSDFKRIVFSDAHDVVFFGDQQRLIGHIDKTQGVLHAAEKNCWPVQVNVPDRGPWRYANGGLCCGTPEAFTVEFDYLSSLPMSQALDQMVFNYMVADEDPMMQIDWKTELFFCLHSGYDELAFIDGKPRNTRYDTNPLFIHANGNWPADEMFKRHEESLCPKSK